MVGIWVVECNPYLQQPNYIVVRVANIVIVRVPTCIVRVMKPGEKIVSFVVYSTSRITYSTKIIGLNVKDCSAVRLDV